MKKQLNQSSIIKSINEVGFRPITEEMVKGYPELKAENVELKLKLERSEAENQEIRIENADQKQLIGTLEQVKVLQQQLIKSKNETIDALRRESDANRITIKLLTEEKSRNEEKEHSKFCLGIE
ncbi:hypothetical protein [Helicobacter pylori]|uniref:hypothetical protein n=1 Tax=Helicobacter pylori TaxID=210 RepID=UPI0012B35EF7|nr:hypothetical protein [Helicobacter pylori]